MRHWLQACLCICACTIHLYLNIYIYTVIDRRSPLKFIVTKPRNHRSNPQSISAHCQQYWRLKLCNDCLIEILYIPTTQAPQQCHANTYIHIHISVVFFLYYFSPPPFLWLLFVVTSGFCKPQHKYECRQNVNRKIISTVT